MSARHAEPAVMPPEAGSSLTSLCAATPEKVRHRELSRSLLALGGISGSPRSRCGSEPATHPPFEAPLCSVPVRARARVRTREEERARIAALLIAEAGSTDGEPGEEGARRRAGRTCCCQAPERERLPFNHVDKAPLCDAAWSQALPRAAQGWRKGGAVLPPASGALAGVIFRRDIYLSRCWHSTA